MAEERVEPPNEKIGWKEIPEMRKRSDYNNILFYEFRNYENVLWNAILGTLSFFGGEVILKILVIKTPAETFDWVYFLKLENGIWIKGVSGGECNINLESTEEETAAILKIKITIQTRNGLRTRVLVKKI